MRIVRAHAYGNDFLLLASALEVGQREARKLAGLPVPLQPLDANPRRASSASQHCRRH